MIKDMGSSVEQPLKIFPKKQNLMIIDPNNSYINTYEGSVAEENNKSYFNTAHLPKTMHEIDSG